MSAVIRDDPFGILETAAPALGTDDVAALAKRHYGLAGDVSALDSERDQNFLVTSADGTRHVIKIANPVEDPGVTDLQTQALRHVGRYAPDIPVPGVRPDRNGIYQVTITHDGATHMLRCLTWLDGTLWHNVKTTPTLRRNLAVTLARLGHALRGFCHPSARHPLLWDLQRASSLRELFVHIDDAEQRSLAALFLDACEKYAKPVLPRLRGQVIYNDLNPGNVLVDPARPDEVIGIIDFGDIMYGPLIVDIAVAAAYQALDTDDPLAAMAEFIGAYHAEVELEPGEVDVVYDLIATRLLTTMTIANWRAAMHPENREYILRDANSASQALQQFSAIPREHAQYVFREACGLPGASRIAAPQAQLLARRRRLLGPAYRLFYERPLHLVRGEGVWLYDADGKRYLDAYNNVPHVGHCHPHVVAALTRQARVLNTHTRYLHETVIDYAERLTSRFPDGLDSAMFCCTGSEANELALRIASTATGGEGIIVVEHGYHGNTRATAQLSTDDYDANEKPGPHVRTVQAPDSYRGALLGHDDLCSYYAGQVAEAIASLDAAGIKVSVLLLDTILSSNGVVTPPAGYLALAAAKVRDAGGLFVADEVQAGFGRTGGHMWGFERHGVIPDIATLGKPMGNGHPLSAVVTSPEILERFAKHTGYFNTFGGNPVSCAVGQAVLDVMDRERLMDNALTVGVYTRDGLTRLMQQYPIIGDVRGAGLFIGAELVRDRKTLEPAGEEATRVVNFMREHGVLISMTGAHDNVLKIRPPLVFSKANADQLLDTLARGLDSL